MSRLIIPADARAILQWDGWTLYELPQREADSPLWYTFKLMQAPGTPAKWGQRRAFLLTWNPVDLRMRKDRERVALEQGHRDLYERIELTLSLTHGPEWLRDVQGLSDAEIQAERDRLAAAARERRARAAGRRGASARAARP